MYHNHTHRVIGHYKKPEKFWYCYKCGTKNSSENDKCEMCGEKLLIRMTVEPIGGKNGESHGEGRYNSFENEKITHRKDDFNLKVMVKLLIHGVLFSILNLMLYIGWAFALLLLVSIGSFIGLGIGIGLLFLGVGYINTTLGVQLWNVEVNTRFWSIFFHGLILTVILVFVGLVINYLPNVVFPSLATSVITFVTTSFVYGYIGREIAFQFT